MRVRHGTKQAARPGRRWRRVLDYGLVLALFVLLAWLAARLDQGVEHAGQQGHPVVNDGDSLTFGTQRVRLRGIDAPEYRQICRNADGDYACGRRAREALVALIAGREVSCSGREHDRYGRILADCSAGDVDLNRELVRSGWAVAYGDFAMDEAAARAAGAGLWAGSFERPQDWRRDHSSLGETERDPLAQIGDWLRQTLRFWLQRTYNLFMDSSGKQA